LLTHIHIRHFVIVSDLSIDFNSGLNVLTGETGAGKSIWVDAVALALGARAGGDYIQAGQDYCDITLSFDLTKQPPAKAWLVAQDFDENDNECIIRRRFKADGKSKCSINSIPCTQNSLKEFAPLLLLSHSQHQHQALLHHDYQRQQLDAYAGLTENVQQLHTLYSRWQKVAAEITVLKNQSPNQAAELELLQYQLQELAQLDPQPGEWLSLSREHQKCHNAKSLIENINQALQYTKSDHDNNADNLIQSAIANINQIATDDKELDKIQELLNHAAIYINEAGDSLVTYKDSLNTSPERLQLLEQRSSLYHDIARKHHSHPEQLLELMSSLQQRITALENLDDNLNNLVQAQQLLEQQYQRLATSISKQRKKSALELSRIISGKIQQLGLENSEFSIQLEPLTTSLNPYGQEKITFMISTNAGQAAQPMHKVVSGGELSRISLALQVITAEKTHPPTLIFDEVDSGIGGETGHTVGKLLKQLGETSQVLCITHLAQIAAKGHHHYKVTKETRNNTTTSAMTKLTEQQRTDEIARMLGGKNKTSAQHAAEMLAG
jgi:DNA repair protein RecN (Recombination protein N)